MDDFKLTLKGDGITVERDIDRATALEILNSILAPRPSAEKRSVQQTVYLPQTAKEQEDISFKLLESASTPAGNNTIQLTKPLSLREFVYEHEPKTNAQTILCIAQFLAEQEDKQRFERDEIRPRFPDAGQALPKNYTRDFQTALDKGWIAPDPVNKELYFVTRMGERQLEEGFRGRRN